MKQVVASTRRQASMSGAENVTANDIQKHFASEMTDLFRLALLLTADADDAERVVILAMRQCFSAAPIVRHRLRVWVRRILVLNAIRIVTGEENDGTSRCVQDEPGVSLLGPEAPADSSPAHSAGILILENIERLTYVLSVLEHYSIARCALLVGRSLKQVREALTSAIETVASFEQEVCPITDQVSAERSWPNSKQGSADLDSTCGTILA